MNAAVIQRALRTRHSKDLYISECKNGPTVTAGARPIRLDGWAFVKTWGPAPSVGYEIKVRRADFLNDNKWQAYLPLCHQFYFVTPKNLIQLEELPEGIGLLEALGPSARLVLRRKAQHRTPDSAAYQQLLHYILMCRVREGGTWVLNNGVEEDNTTRRRREVEEWTEWLRTRVDGQELGQRISYEVAKELRRMRQEAENAKALVRGYESTRQVLHVLGFDPDIPVSEWRLERLAQSLNPIDRNLIKSVESLRDQLTDTLTKLRNVRSGE